MKLHHKKRRPLTREEKTYRDDRIVVIATEDTYIPASYFRLFRSPRIKTIVLPSENGLCSPSHVMARLDSYADEYDLGKDDELWLMLDIDRWTESSHVANFKRVCREATQKRFHLAHSNPCFEVWLLLHFAALGPSDQYSRCDAVVQRLKEILGQYNKRRIDPERFTMDAIGAAVTRAEELDPSPDSRWPQKTGTHVYRIVKKLLPR